MHRFLLLSIGYSVIANPQALEPAISVIADDWVRFNSNSWILWTDKTIFTCFEIIKGRLLPNDQFLMVKLDTTERHGWEPQWVWEWFDKPRGSNVAWNSLAGYGISLEPPVTDQTNWLKVLSDNKT
jgi:hypothetical protein